MPEIGFVQVMSESGLSSEVMSGFCFSSRVMLGCFFQWGYECISNDI